MTADELIAVLEIKTGYSRAYLKSLSLEKLQEEYDKRS